jgi:hypothetical protein
VRKACNRRALFFRILRPHVFKHLQSQPITKAEIVEEIHYIFFTCIHISLKIRFFELR